MATTRSQRQDRMSGLQRQPVSSPLQAQSPCTRCGGLMVAELWGDFPNSRCELECPGRRCVQCGDIVDAVILRNRLLNQHSSCIQTKGGAASLTNVHVAA